MKIIKTEPLEFGGHCNQTTSGEFPVPEGWAVIPEDFEIPDSYPFVDLEVEEGVVTGMTPREVPPAPEPGESAEDILNIILGEEVGE